VKEKQFSVGEIPYTNCFPIYYHLRHRCELSGVRFVAGSPACLNAALCKGELDLCPSSSIEYARHPEGYLLLPRFCIGSVKTIWSIRLFSRMPIEQLDRKTVVLTGESDTSVILCRIILGRFMGFDNEFRTEIIDLEEALEKADAVLLIGDRALAAGRRLGNLYSYDLGGIWHQQTGLPFVFALWTMREDAARTHAEILKEFWQALCEAHRSISSPDEELVSSALKAKPFLTPTLVKEYWRMISYELSQEHLKGLKLFYSLGNEIGALESQPEIRFYEL